MKLSILICTHPVRWPLLNRMVQHLESQIDDPDAVEICIRENVDAKLRGATRNELVEAARGRYCVAVDDDDVVSDDYVSKIMVALYKHPDICGISGAVTSLANGDSVNFKLSIQYPELFSLPSKSTDDGWYRRFASHLNPMRREILQTVRFPDHIDTGHDDNAFSLRLQQYREKHPLREVEIPGMMYYYFNRVAIR